MTKRVKRNIRSRRDIILQLKEYGSTCWPGGRHVCIIVEQAGAQRGRPIRNLTVLCCTRAAHKKPLCFSWQRRLAVCNVDGQQPPHGCAAVAFRGAVPPENQSASLLVRVTYCVVLDDTDDDDDDDDQLRSSWSWCVTEKVRIVHLTLHRRCVTEKARIMYFTQHQYHYFQFSFDTCWLLCKKTID